eukprot:8323487-Pyramimonas_sp.AAC.1
MYRVKPPTHRWLTDSGLTDDSPMAHRSQTLVVEGTPGARGYTSWQDVGCARSGASMSPDLPDRLEMHSSKLLRGRV